MKNPTSQLADSAENREAGRIRWTRESIGGLARRGGNQSPESLARRIAELPALLARAGFELPEEALPISRFKASYADTLQRVKNGQPQLVTQGRARFFVLSEEQVLQLLEASESQLTLGDALEGLPAAPEGDAPLRSAQMPESLGQHRLRR